MAAYMQYVFRFSFHFIIFVLLYLDEQLNLKNVFFYCIEYFASTFICEQYSFVSWCYQSPECGKSDDDLSLYSFIISCLNAKLTPVGLSIVSNDHQGATSSIHPTIHLLITADDGMGGAGPSPSGHQAMPVTTLILKQCPFVCKRMGMMCYDLCCWWVYGLTWVFQVFVNIAWRPRCKFWF